MRQFGVMVFALWLGLFGGVSLGIAESPPTMPCSVRGYLYVNDKQIGAEAGDAYTIVATREDRTHFEPSVVGDLGEGFFILDIPVQTGGAPADAAAPGDKILLHVYWMGSKLLVTEPAEATVPVGTSGEVLIQNIRTMTGPGEVGRFYTREELDAAVAEAVERWDAGGDGRIGLEEAIHALRVVSGN